MVLENSPGVEHSQAEESFMSRCPTSFHSSDAMVDSLPAALPFANSLTGYSRSTCHPLFLGGLCIMPIVFDKDWTGVLVKIPNMFSSELLIPSWLAYQPYTGFSLDPQECYRSHRFFRGRFERLFFIIRPLDCQVIPFLHPKLLFVCSL